jgi:hypothetical protein
MGSFIGANVQNVTKRRQGEVFTSVVQTVIGTVMVPANLSTGDALKMATLLTSTDGGVTWNSLETAAFSAGDAPYAADEEVYFQGHIYKSDVADNANERDVADGTDLGEWNANGILYNDIVEDKKTTVVVTGDVMAKHLIGLDDYLKVILFRNKIITK